MSAPVKCGTCACQWSQDEFGTPCEWCKDYDRENEIYTAFHGYIPALNADLVRNIPNMNDHQLAGTMVRLCKETSRDWDQDQWLNWLGKRVTE